MAPTAGGISEPPCHKGNNQLWNRGSPPEIVPLTRALVVGLVKMQIPYLYAVVNRDQRGW